MFLSARFWNKPEYFFNPKQFIRRIFQSKTNHLKISGKTLWGDAISFNPNEDIGRSLRAFGLYDLSLSEVLWRLTSPGSRVLDIGGNVGYFSLLLANRVGGEGEVHTFEPNPDLYSFLEPNIEKIKNIKLHKIAVSDKNGEKELYKPKDYSLNTGLATLENISNGVRVASVSTRTIDSMNFPAVDLVKIDIEGHELAALRGAEKTLMGVKDVIFEEHNIKGSGVKEILLSQGFNIFYIQKKFSGVALKNIQSVYLMNSSEPPNYLASRRPSSELNDLFAKRSWSILKCT
jgi:FkbM family methyltransferase